MHVYFKEVYFLISYFLYSLAITFLSSFIFHEQLLYVITKPFICYKLQNSFIFINITEAFLSTIYLCLYSCFFFCIPILLYFIWHFLVTSLYKNEYIWITSIFKNMLRAFYLAHACVYLFILPSIIAFFLNFEIADGLIQMQLETRISTYITLSLQIFFVFSIFFQSPILIYCLISLQIIKIENLIKIRNYMFFSFLLLSAIVSPPDIITQTSIFLLLLFFYEFSIFYYIYTKN